MTVEILEDKEAVAERAANLLCSAISAPEGDAPATESQVHPFSVMLAGGTTPRILYQLLARHPWNALIPWDRTFWYFGDERYVASDHPDSNFRMAKETLFDPAGVDTTKQVRVRTELPVEDAAADYEVTIARNFDNVSASVPRFDVILLGMGADGHTASLFPHTEALSEEKKLYTANYVEKLEVWRLTVTPPVLEAARIILVLVTGGDKAPALRHVLEGEYDVDTYPAQLLRDLPSVTWLIDKAAASMLTRQSDS